MILHLFTQLGANSSRDAPLHKGYCSELKLIPPQCQLNQNKLNYNYSKKYATGLPNLALKLYF